MKIDFYRIIKEGMVRRSLRTSSISSARSALKKTPERAASSARKRAGSPSEANSTRANKRGKEGIRNLGHRPKLAKTNGSHGRDSRIRGSQDSGANSATTSSENSELSSDEGDEDSYSDYGEDDKEHNSSVKGESGSSVASSDSISESEFEDDVRRKKKHGSHNKSSIARKKTPGSSQIAPAPSNVRRHEGPELWRQGVRAGLGPGTEMVIERPKPRDAGNVPYSDATIHPNTMLFLGDLKANNDREWLKSTLPFFY